MVLSRLIATAAAPLAALALVTACSGGEAPTTEQTNAESSPAAQPTASATDSPTTAANSDEEQVSEAVLAFQDAYNTQNWDVYLEMMCTAMRDQFTGPTMDVLKKSRNDQGLTTVTVTEVTLDGDAATATLDAQNELLGRQPIVMTLAREDGWKICMPHQG